jgi:hypothetical protein
VVLEVSVVIVLQQSYSIFQRFVGMVAGFSLPDCSVVVPVVLSACTAVSPVVSPELIDSSAGFPLVPPDVIDCSIGLPVVPPDVID